MEQTTLTLTPWYVAYIPGLISYMAGVLSSLGATKLIKPLLDPARRKSMTRLFSFVFGGLVTSCIWLAFYGFSWTVIMVGVVAGVTAPVTWDIYRVWATRNTPHAIEPDLPDITDRNT